MHADARETQPAGGRPALYETFVPRPDPLRERLLDGFGWVLRLVRPAFEFEGERYPYFLHPYNRTIRNERCVEIPIALAQLRAFTGRRALEVGNVLSHYTPITHTVVDKYETAPGVVNADIADYRPSEPFDLILSVSTLEHVGWDEDVRDPSKLPAALDNLIGSCLRPGGRLVVTLPLGYNADLDAALEAGTLPFTACYWLRRLSRWAHWEQCEREAVRGARYDAPYQFANALLVGVVEKQA